MGKTSLGIIMRKKAVASRSCSFDEAVLTCTITCSRKTEDNYMISASTQKSLLLISACLCIEIQSLLLSLYNPVCVRLVNLFVEIHFFFHFCSET